MRRLSAALLLAMALTVLATGCSRFVTVYYDETPTVRPLATFTPVPAAQAGPTETPMPSSTATPAGPTMLRLDPTTVILSSGESSRVSVMLDNARDVQEVELHLSFEPRYLEIESPQAAPGEIPPPNQIIQNEVINDDGLILYHVRSTESVSGSGVVASFTVRGELDGGSPLSFNIVELYGPGPEPLPTPNAADGMVIVNAQGVTPKAEPEPTSTPAADGQVCHTVQRGENLYRIALRYDTTVAAIVAANGLPSARSIRAGQVLVIPTGEQATPVTHTVQPGETLYAIAQRYNRSVEAIAKENNLAPPYTIKVGQTLIVAR